MAYGLPVITTDRCVAGLELVEEGVNGSIVPVEDAAALAGKMKVLLSSALEKMGTASPVSYTHLDVYKRQDQGGQGERDLGYAG